MYTYVFSFLDFPLIQVVTEHLLEFPVLYRRFSLVIYFIHVSVYMSVSQFIPPPFPPWCLYVHSHKDKHIIDINYMWNLKKNDTDELIYKAEIETQTSKPLILFLNFILLLLVMFNVSKHKLSLLCFQYTICFRQCLSNLV